jgi:outer membrane receptor protein involved in Fe transport
LFSLQGGEVKAALGVEHRRDYIDDVPGPERAAGDLYGYSTIAETKGSDVVNEAFAELQVPIFKDRPFFNTLELDGSVRYTHYRSYGSDVTYHVNGQWAPIAAVRFRGNYGTNFRAPNLYEQFVADQVGFYSGGLDPCDDFALNYSPGSTVYENCLAALTPILGANAVNFFTTGSIPVTTRGGHGNLTAEKAKTWGFGTVFTAPRRIADFSLAVDYWNVTVKGEVGTLGNLILDFCYQATDFPNNPYCALIGPRLPAGDTHQGEISAFDNPYLNISKQAAQGIDFDARFAAPLFGGRFSTQLQATRNLHQKLEYFKGDGLHDYNGTLGYPGFGAGPKWVGTLDTRFKTGNNITFRWGVKFVGPANSQRFAPQTVVGGVPVYYDLEAERYWEHGASVQWLWQNIGQVTLGVNNIFNEKPPRISDSNQSQPRIGNFFANGPYDYRGRSIFINVTRTFKPF